MDRLPKIVTVRFGAGEDSQEGGYGTFGPHRFLGRKFWKPSTDILETEDAVHIVFDLAGMAKEEIKVEVREGLLRVSGARKRVQVPGVMRCHRMEIDYGPFEKLFRIPPELDLATVTAVHINGFLELTIQKRQTKEPIRIIIVHEDEY